METIDNTIFEIKTKLVKAQDALAEAQNLRVDGLKLFEATEIGNLVRRQWNQLGDKLRYLERVRNASDMSIIADGFNEFEIKKGKK